MSSSLRARFSAFALVLGMGLVMSVSTAGAAEFGIEKFFAANCKESASCNPAAEAKEEKKNAEEHGFTQAAGHPNFGVTDFTVASHEVALGQREPNAVVRHIRVDVAPGLSTNPEAVPKCSLAEFGAEVAEGVFLPPNCPPASEIGVNNVVVFAGGFDVPLEGKVYNLEQASAQTPGLSSLFGVAVSLEPLGLKGLFAHTLIEGGIEYASDYHDFFEIHVSEKLPLLKSRLAFKGNIGTGGFLTNPTTCTPPGPQTTTTLTLESEVGEPHPPNKSYETPIGATGCNLVPFAPALSVEPETKVSDAPDGVTATLSVPHDPDPAKLDSSDLRTATVVLPSGMTLNPAAAAGLEGCTPEQIAIGTRNGTACPPRSRVGTVTLNVPGLPAESLKGYLYLGKPASGPIEGPPYTVYLDAESAKYNIKVRVKGTVAPNLATGQVTATFAENPEQPFSSVIVHLNGGAFAPIANPLQCGTALTTTLLTPDSGNPAPETLVPPFTVEACASNPPPVNWSQATAAEPATAGASTSFTFKIERSDGNQYLAKIATKLPPGVLGTIPAVTQCTEAQANSESCPASSRIGSVTVAAGAGSQPYPFKGSVYLTESFEGAPFGLSIVVPASVGPFNLGNVRARASVAVDPFTAQVILADKSVPMIVGGVPTRIKSLTVTIDRQGFERNPTNCAELQTVSVVTGSLGGIAEPKSAFQAEGCEKLAFKPAFSASTSAKVTKLNGTGLKVKITEVPGQANIRSTVTMLPKALPSRLTTLQKACLAATFVANPLGCSPESMVGTAEAVTPTLSTPLKGPAFFVSHGGEEFPDLDIVLEGSGVRIILVGKTNIKNGITTTTFGSTPDAPVSSFTLNLPAGPHSALTGNGNLCAHPLVMPTTITAQNGKVFKQNTKISVSGCGVQIVGHRIVGSTAYLTVRTFTGGRISARGAFLSTVSKRVSRATNATSLKVRLSTAGRRHRPLRTTVRVGFVPSNHSAHSNASLKLRFR